MANEIGFTDHSRLISPIERAEDFDTESNLRPQRLCDYVGQEKIKENLSQVTDRKRIVENFSQCGS